MSTLCNGWKFTSNHQCDEDGRIILIWKDPLKLRVLSQSSQAITCEIMIPGHQTFIYTAIYASNLAEEQNYLWVELLQLHSTLSLDVTPWMIGGDLNQILFGSEHFASADNINYSQMYQFRDCLHQMGIFDLRYVGPHHTWTNKQDDSPVAKKLDRQLINSPIIPAFPHATTSFLLPPPLLRPLPLSCGPCLSTAQSRYLPLPLPKLSNQTSKLHRGGFRCMVSGWKCCYDSHETLLETEMHQEFTKNFK